MKNYLDLMQNVLTNGHDKGDRTGTGTKSLFGKSLEFDLRDGFPLVTTKFIHMKSVVHELLWFLRGDSNIQYLTEHGVHIWDEWADLFGDLGPVYGKQWRSWDNYTGGGVDQIANAITTLRTDPDSRRIIVSAWNVADLPHMKLEPCHLLFQFYSREMTRLEKVGTYLALVDRGGDLESLIGETDEAIDRLLITHGLPLRYLSCQMYQRSADLFLGVPFNIASYALLTEMIACVTDHHAHTLKIVFGDVHLYNNHLGQAREQLSRTPFEAPLLDLTPKTSIDAFVYGDIRLEEYQYHPAIRAPIAV